MVSTNDESRSLATLGMTREAPCCHSEERSDEESALDGFYKRREQIPRHARDDKRGTLLSFRGAQRRGIYPGSFLTAPEQIPRYARDDKRGTLLSFRGAKRRGICPRW